MTSALATFVDVVFPASLETPLTYRVPAAWRDAAMPGKRVAAPLGRRTVTGYLVGMRKDAPVQDIKDLGEILDSEPLLDAHLLALTKWVAEYYLCPWGEVIRTALPPGIDALTRRVASATDAGRAALDGNAILPPDEREILAFVGGRGSAPIGTLTRRWARAAAHIHALSRRGLLAVASELRRPRVRPLSVSYCDLASGVDPEAVPLPSRAVKQRAILRALAAAPGGMPRAAAAAGSPAALAVLLRKGMVQVRKVEVTRDPFATAAQPSDTPKVLAASQAQALQLIRQVVAEQRFRPILLHGVTGSGKTEVYLQAIETVLAQERQALVLVPEISLTPLAVQRFLARFGGRVAVLHSGLRGGERFDAWRRIKSGQADIVVGAPSSFARMMATSRP
jgi:primosomal protein N' (replication factor Y) (superfamily II helicase)